MSLAKFTTLAARQVDCYCIEGLCAHEVGHLLGLGHDMSEASLMKPVLTIKDSLMTGIDSETVRSFLDLYGDGPSSAGERATGFPGRRRGCEGRVTRDLGERWDLDTRSAGTHQPSIHKGTGR
jgi:hypothetical protein